MLIGGGGWIRTNDLRIMIPTKCLSNGAAGYNITEMPMHEWDLDDQSLAELAADSMPDDDHADVVADVRDFFKDPRHWIYTSKGSPFEITPDSVYHIAQLWVLFEDSHFHFRTQRAIRDLRSQGFLSEREVKISGTTRSLVVWRSNVRYVERAIKAHVDLMTEYSAPTLTKATGDYAETLVLLGLSRLQLSLISRNSNSYKGKTWTETEHDLDFIMEKDGSGFGVEVKNTWDYIPTDELDVKLRLCEYLGLRPLFVVRHRHSGQWDLVRKKGGMLYIFKSKIFPPGYNQLTQSIWQQMRLPVAAWNDWPRQFYPTLEKFIEKK